MAVVTFECPTCGMVRTQKIDFGELHQTGEEISPITGLYCQYCKHLYGQTSKTFLSIVNFHFDDSEESDFEVLFQNFL